VHPDASCPPPSLTSAFGSMNIRPASVPDADRVLTFLHEFQAEGLQTVLQHNTSPTLEQERAFIGKLSGSAGVMLIALKEDRVVGCLTAETATHGQLCHSCEFGMAVLRAERGGGIGTALICHLSEWANAMGMRRIQLKVFARNTGALRLYHRLGYEVEGTRRQAIKIGDRYEDLIEMAKTTVHGDAA